MPKEYTHKLHLSKRKKTLIIISISLLTLVISAVFAFYLIFTHKLHDTFPGNPIEAIVNSKPLKTTNDQTNFLLFGTSYDDPNPSHSGGYLTDSLVILSINQQTKQAHTMSIPRDLWVTYDTSCNLGASGKINAVYLCALNSYGQSETEKATTALAEKITNITGLPIHYHIEINYTIIQSLTDALGGIDVDIYSSDSRGIYDPNVGLTLPVGINHLDGKTALKLARARNAAGGYGLPRSNFDREINQQRIITGIFKKISANGTLSDMSTSLQLVDTLGKEVRTNIQTSELQSALSLARSLNVSNFISIPLIEYLTTDSINGQSIVRPIDGIDSYATLKHYIQASLQPRGME